MSSVNPIPTNSSSLEISNFKKRHPDFYKFFIKIQPYMEHFKHTMQTIDTEPALLLNDRLTKWSEIKSLLGIDSNKSYLKNKLPLPRGWRYVEKGIEKQDLTNWKELKPCWTDKRDSFLTSGHYYLDVVSIKKGFFYSSRHCCIRLIDQRKVYSVGFCGKVYTWLPLRHQKGKLACPDPLEYEKNQKLCTTIKIDKNDFDKLKTKIETDQREQNLHFHMVAKNCSAYVVALLNEINIPLNNQEFPPQFLARSVYSIINEKPSSYSLKFLHYLFHVSRLILAPLYTIALFLLGAAYRNSDIAQDKKTQISRIFDVSNFHFATGLKVAHWQEYLIEQASENQKEVFSKNWVIEISKKEHSEFRY